MLSYTLQGFLLLFKNSTSFDRLKMEEEKKKKRTRISIKSHLKLKLSVRVGIQELFREIISNSTELENGLN